MGGVHAARGGNGVEASVNVLASVEGVGELLGARVELGGHVHLLGQLAAVRHAARGVKRVSHIQRRLRVLDIFDAGGEGAGLGFELFDDGLVVLNLCVDLGIKLALSAHLLKNFVLVGALRVFQS